MVANPSIDTDDLKTELERIKFEKEATVSYKDAVGFQTVFIVLQLWFHRSITTFASSLVNIYPAFTILRIKTLKDTYQ